MSETTPHYRARIVSSIAATVMALACGTNYAYSAWAPQFADKLKLSATQSNLIGTAGNLGMYVTGVPVGILVDTKGPRLAVVMGAILLALGYFPLHAAYDSGSGSVLGLCIASFSTGMGGCAAFAAAIKTSALNWAHHRGTATAFPLAGFGLSAFFFSMVSQFVFPGDTGDFLMLLASGTFGMVGISFFFLRVIPNSPTKYAALPSNEGIGSNSLHRTKSEDSRHRGGVLDSEPGMSSEQLTPMEEGVLNQREIDIEAPEVSRDSDESSSLMSNASLGRDPNPLEDDIDERRRRIDIRGFKMLPMAEFWQLFSLMGILTGIGLMTINNIGNDVTALWRHYDDSVDSGFIVKRQALHVSVLSVGSFVGRLCSGVGSDLLVKKLHASRFWCLVFASLIFTAAQVFALNITNPNLLTMVSGLTGLAYGFLFGVYPSLVAEAFGVHGLSQNWGCMTLAPVVSGNIFNLFYGSVYDKHSAVLPGGERECLEGLECYRSAYWVTFGACLVGLAISLWSIRYAHAKHMREHKEHLSEREA